jgi:signal transduction histidine kinase
VPLQLREALFQASPPRTVHRLSADKGDSTWLAAPIEDAPRTLLGGLFVNRRAPFEEADERTFVLLALLASTALKNARLSEEVRRSEGKAMTAHEVMKEATRRKEEFFALLGHELRNPLSPILGVLDLVKVRGGAVCSAYEFAIMERQSRHLARLVDDLLDAARAMRGAIRLDKRLLELSTAVFKAVESARPLIEERLHHLHLRVPERGLLLEADEGRLTQVIVNLLSNSAKFTERGGNIYVTATRVRGEIVLRVRDDGCGISRDLLEHLFDPLSAEITFGGTGGGLGLGLTLVRRFTEAHGGRVTVKSSGIGKGSEFVVRLPAAPAGAAPAASPREHVGACAQPRRILVVDDNRDAAETIAAGLSLLGHCVQVALEGEEALDKAERFHPEVAVLDLGLPGMDGFELATRLLARCGTTPPRLIALTGFGQPRDVRRTRAAGFAMHLVKPVGLESLAKAVSPEG